MRLLIRPVALLSLLALALSSPAAGAPEQYFIVFLRPDPNRKPLAKEQGERLQAAHMANIQSMAERGVLIAAGPFDDTPRTYSGIFMFKVASLDEARRIAAGDPTVTEHRNLVEAYAWQGPAGIGDEYQRRHKADPKTPENMGVHPLFLVRGQATKDHETYIAGLRSQGKVAASGPITGDPELTGMIVFNRIPDTEARELMQADPAVKSGGLRLEQHRWWSAEHVLPK